MASHKTFLHCALCLLTCSSFLDTVDRISHPEYIPSDDDILQARVKTLAVTEHVFHIENVAYRYAANK